MQPAVVRGALPGMLLRGVWFGRVIAVMWCEARIYMHRITWNMSSYQQGAISVLMMKLKDDLSLVKGKYDDRYKRQGLTFQGT